jgi:hypothetical protein
MRWTWSGWGATGAVAYTYPAFTDGLVYMSSAVLLSAVRRREPAQRLAWWSLAAGIALTLAANVYAGIVHGLLERSSVFSRP